MVACKIFKEYLQGVTEVRYLDFNIKDLN